MRALSRLLTFILQFVVLGLAVAFVVTRLLPAPPAPVQATGQPQAPAGPVSYAEAVERAAPAVVNIYANKIVTERTYRVFPDPVLQRFFGSRPVGPPRQRLEQSLGSGVLVSADGYVLTNNHVISGAEDIQVVLQDGRATQARVIGTDADTDLAILKIEGSGLPAAGLAESPPVRVGDVVLAIGNPFGMGQTVTQGIISAKGRNQLDLSTYENFIQTDAAINEGNSGGALVNAQGELVGINTAMFSRMARDAEGIGFAIPVEIAREVMEQIVRDGFVTRGWMGAEYVDLPPAALARQGAPEGGVQIALTLPGGPADRAGVLPGDIILAFKGQAVGDLAGLRTLEAESAPGSRVRLEGLRAGVPFSTEVELVQRPGIQNPPG
jgi:serine protease DegQ